MSTTNEEKIYKVKNRSTSISVYNIPELGIRREFAPGEIKKITESELTKLTYQPGGDYLLSNFLQIFANDEEREDLGVKAEIEYNMSEQDVINLIKEGSLDSFLDCLDFAPVGVIDLIKKYSIMIPLTDYDKRKALLQKTGYDVDKILANLEAEKAEDQKPTVSQPTRRVQQKVESETPVRRNTSTKYNIID